MSDMTIIARDVLALAKSIDPKMPQPDRAVLMGWAATFEGRRVWHKEARDAVTDFYAQHPDRRIMPADVIAYCKRQPFWSSPDHVIECLYSWADDPHSAVDAIRRCTGMEPPLVPVPEGEFWGVQKKILVAGIKKWIAEREGELIRRAIELKQEPLAIEARQ